MKRKYTSIHWCIISLEVKKKKKVINYLIYLITISFVHSVNTHLLKFYYILTVIIIMGIKI